MSGITRLICFHSDPEPTPTVYRDVDRDLYGEKQQLVWLYFPLHEGEVIKDVFVRDHRDDSSPCCPDLNVRLLYRLRLWFRAHNYIS